MGEQNRTANTPSRREKQANFLKRNKANKREIMNGKATEKHKKLDRGKPRPLSFCLLSCRRVVGKSCTTELGQRQKHLSGRNGSSTMSRTYRGFHCVGPAHRRGCQTRGSVRRIATGRRSGTHGFKALGTSIRQRAGSGKSRTRLWCSEHEWVLVHQRWRDQILRRRVCRHVWSHDQFRRPVVGQDHGQLTLGSKNLLCIWVTDHSRHIVVR